MQQLILKKEITAVKMEALLHFLKSWDIDAELKTSPVMTKKKSQFSLTAGIWKDSTVDAKELRKNAWKRN